MATRRSIHKKIVLCEQLADVSDLAKLAFTWGILHTDDWGVIKASPRSFKAEVMPLHDATAEEMKQALDALVAVQLIVRYTFQGVPYVCFPTFDNYQDGLHKRTTMSQLPRPFDADEGSIENSHLLSNQAIMTSGKFRETPGTSENAPELPGTSGKTPDVSGKTAELPGNSLPREVKGSKEKRSKENLNSTARAELAPPEKAILSTNNNEPQPHIQFAEKLWLEFRQQLPCPKPVVTAAGQFRKSHGQRGADLLLMAFGSMADGFNVPDGADPATYISARVREAINRNFEWDPEKQRQRQPRSGAPLPPCTEKIITDDFGQVIPNAG